MTQARLSENDTLISLIGKVIAEVRKKTHHDPERLAHKHETIAAKDFDRTMAIQIIGLIEQVTAEPLPKAA
jgi:hypothetical protein